MKNNQRMISALAAVALASGLTLHAVAYSATDIYTQQAAMQQNEFNATYIAIRPAETESNYVNYFEWTQAAGLAIYCEDTAFLADEYGIDCTAYAERLAYYQNFGASEESYVITDITLPQAYQSEQENVYFIAVPEEETLTKLIADARVDIIGMAQLTQRVKAWLNTDATTIVIDAAEGYTVDAAMLSELGAGAATYDAAHNYWTFADTLSGEALFAFCAELETTNEIAFAWPYGVFGPSAEYYTVTACEVVAIEDYVTFGDVNGDDKVDSLDAIRTLQEYAANITGGGMMSASERASADVNGDSVVDSGDAVLMLRYYTQSLGGGTPDWNELLVP